MDIKKLPVVIVVAMAKNRVIGRDNAMPWHLPADLKHFRAVTMGKPMIMGRRTFESIGKPLPGRETIIVTRNADYAAPAGVHLAASLRAALVVGQSRAEAMGASAVTVVGGGDIYRQALPFADRLEITEIDALPEGDTHFPAVDLSHFREAGRETHPPLGGVPGYAFVSFVRI